MFNKKKFNSFVANRGNYTAIPNELMHSEISHHAKLLMMYFLSCTEEFHPSYRLIERKLGIRKSGIKDYIQELIEHKMIELIKLQNNKQYYSITDPRIWLTHVDWIKKANKKAKNVDFETIDSITDRVDGVKQIREDKQDEMYDDFSALTNSKDSIKDAQIDELKKELEEVKNMMRQMISGNTSNVQNTIAKEPKEQINTKKEENTIQPIKQSSKDIIIESWGKEQNIGYIDNTAHDWIYSLFMELKESDISYEESLNSHDRILDIIVPPIKKGQKVNITKYNAKREIAKKVIIEQCDNAYEIENKIQNVNIKKAPVNGVLFTDCSDEFVKFFECEELLDFIRNNPEYKKIFGDMYPVYCREAKDEDGNPTIPVKTKDFILKEVQNIYDLKEILGLLDKKGKIQHLYYYQPGKRPPLIANTPYTPEEKRIIERYMMPDGNLLIERSEGINFRSGSVINQMDDISPGTIWI